MNDEEIQQMSEYLMYLRQRESNRLEELRRNGSLCEFILNLHQEMIYKYPDMIEHNYTEEEIDDMMGGRNE